MPPVKVAAVSCSDLAGAKPVVVTSVWGLDFFFERVRGDGWGAAGRARLMGTCLFFSKIQADPDHVIGARTYRAPWQHETCSTWLHVGSRTFTRFGYTYWNLGVISCNFISMTTKKKNAAKSAAPNPQTTASDDFETIKTTSEAADILRRIRQSAGISMSHFSSEAIKEKAQRDHPAILK